MRAAWVIGTGDGRPAIIGEDSRIQPRQQKPPSFDFGVIALSYLLSLWRPAPAVMRSPTFGSPRRSSMPCRSR